LPFSGGKFIANCLALSRHVVCNHLYLAHEDLEFEIYNDQYYQFKLASVMHSLPKNFETTRAWTEFMGIDIPSTYEQNRQDIVTAIREKQKTICHIAHWNGELERWQQKYPNLKVCKLINFKNFNTLCYDLKSPQGDRDTHIQGFDFWIDNTPPGDFEIDIDQLMYNSESFLEQIKELYNFFNLDDYCPSLLLDFYQSYKKIHSL
jgi:hypothetical protein